MDTLRYSTDRKLMQTKNIANWRSGSLDKKSKLMHELGKQRRNAGQSKIENKNGQKLFQKISAVKNESERTKDFHLKTIDPWY
jgi:hypothetical protein